MRRLALAVLVFAVLPLAAAAACNGQRCVYIPVADGGTGAGPLPSASPRPSSGASPVPSAAPGPSPSATPPPATPSNPPHGALLWSELPQAPDRPKRSE